MRRSPQRFSKATGFSLVEMMIAIVVGLVVVGGVIGVFASAVKSHTDNLRMTRLNQELRTTMNLMTRELRRAGFWGGAKTGVVVPDPAGGILRTLNTPGQLVTGNLFASSPPPIAPDTSDCITFSYDEDNNGLSATTESRGFQLDRDSGAVESGTNTGGGCGTGTWTAITDPNAVEITGLAFSLTPNATVDVDGADSRPCQPGECVGSAIRTVDTTNTVTVWEINITLTGHLTDDASVTRTLQETVRVYQ
jgi:prepilin peptidase dependent protein B